jgi:tetratricopeptide (TPR) repeat protein
VAFYRSSAGLYGDEGPQLTAQLAAMSTALDQWDQTIRDIEREARSRLQSVDDAQTRLQIHTTLASLYVERGRLSDAAREFDEDIRLDPRRAAFHRLKGLVLQAMSRPAEAALGAGRSADADRLTSTASRVAEQPDVAEAADAFRTAWLLDPDDPQNAYRLIAYRSPGATPEEIGRARETLANLERRLIRREQAGTPAPFTNLSGIIDDAGGGMAFVPAAYANGFSFILQGELDRGVAELRAAIANDPLATDPASRSEPMVRGIVALREGVVAQAIEHLETAVAGRADSSEVHRVLATAYAITGDIARSVQHLRDAVRLNPRDERARLALVQTLASVGRSAEADEAVRTAVAALPDASALRWRLSTRSQAGQDADDRALIDMADRLVLLVGKGELYRALAGLAQLHLDEARAIGLLERAVRTTPNNAAAHKALGRAYVENGREVEGYAELVVALLLDPNDVEALTALGTWHLMADNPGDSVARSVDALERAVSIDPTNRLAVQALAGALIRVGRVSEGKQRLQEAERLQAQAIEDDRRVKTAAVLGLNAEMRMAERDYVGAADIWRQAIQLQPGSAAVHLRLAEALAAANRLDEAVAEYLTAISLNAGTDTHRRLAELYDSLGRTGEARRARAVHVERRLEELRQRAEGAYGF